ncbi:MAG: hypothetical protein ABL936_25860 [Aestuariivirga sp.]
MKMRDRELGNCNDHHTSVQPPQAEIHNTFRNFSDGPISDIFPSDASSQNHCGRVNTFRAVEGKNFPDA